jgi:sulfur-carrier protein
VSDAAITVTVKLFAIYQEVYGVSELVWSFDDHTPVQAVCDRLIHEHPELSQWRDFTKFGINLQFVSPQTILKNDDEVVLIPPVNGG